MLIGHGHKFLSETDTEVIGHLIEENYTGDTSRALQATIKQLKGSFAMAVINQDEPEKIFAARKDSPMVIGLGEGQYFLASDVTAFLKYTNKAIFMEDGDMAILSKEGINLTDFEGREVFHEITTIEWDLEAAEKGGYEHFMLKEIHEQPQSLKQAISGRLDELKGNVMLKEISLTEEEIQKIRRIIIIACGTSYHAGMLGKYVIEELTDMPVSIEIGSEFRYSHSRLGRNDAHHRALPIGRNGRYHRRSKGRHEERRPRHRRYQRGRKYHLQGSHRHDIHDGRPGNRGGGHEDVHGAGRRHVHARPCTWAVPGECSGHRKPARSSAP